jgi:hypothetical protein
MMLAIPINLTIASVVDHLYVRPRDRRLEAARPAVVVSPPAELVV